jgi:hypothetical protein
MLTLPLNNLPETWNRQHEKLEAGNDGSRDAGAVCRSP